MTGYTAYLAEGSLLLSRAYTSTPALESLHAPNGEVGRQIELSGPGMGLALERYKSIKSVRDSQSQRDVPEQRLPATRRSRPSRGA